MPQIRLNSSHVGKIIPPNPQNGKATQELYRDDQLQGFGLRVTSQGSKSYFVEKRVHGKNKRITIGRHGQITPVQARKEAQRLLGEMTLGKDPLAEKRKAAVKGTTLGQAFQDYLSARKDLKPRTISDYKVCIEQSLSDWHDIALTAIDKNMIESRHRQLGKRSHARANNTMRVLRAVFNYAMDKYEDGQGRPLVPFNPVDRLSKNRGWYKVERRRTLLKPHELKPWYEATLKLNQETTRDYLHFLLFTGLRRSEASRMTWADVDMQEQTFVRTRCFSVICSSGKSTIFSSRHRH
ncbi:MAG: integrase family protein [Pseudomonadales bacterium]